MSQHVHWHSTAGREKSLCFSCWTGLPGQINCPGPNHAQLVEDAGDASSASAACSSRLAFSTGGHRRGIELASGDSAAKCHRLPVSQPSWEIEKDATNGKRRLSASLRAATLLTSPAIRTNTDLPLRRPSGARSGNIVTGDTAAATAFTDQHAAAEATASESTSRSS